MNRCTVGRYNKSKPIAKCLISDRVNEYNRNESHVTRLISSFFNFRYYTKLTLDFHTNKRIIEEVALIPSKPLRNKIAGFITHLMKRLQRSTVRGISIKLQEEERERRDNYVPDVSALEQDIIEVDSETKDMLKMMDFQSIPGLQLTTNRQPGNYRA